MDPLVLDTLTKRRQELYKLFLDLYSSDSHAARKVLKKLNQVEIDLARYRYN